MIENRVKIKQIGEKHLNTSITVCGWIKTLRDQKTFAFIELTDGSCFGSLQIIASNLPPNLSTGASIGVEGTLVESKGKGQKWEVQAEKIEVFGTCPSDYPLQKKRHSFEYLRTIAHLRPRTNTQGAVARIRNSLAFATHKFFQERDFFYIHTPIISAADTEGGGEQFAVTTLNLEKVPTTSEHMVDYGKDFFGRPTYLTVSGQLNGEIYACALSDIYTFGPTFRAENSHTSRHLAEFWMIEPEMAFTDLAGNVKNACEYIQYVIKHILENDRADLEFFNNFIEKGLIERLEHVATSPFEHVTYTKAVELLKESGRSFEFPVEWGNDLQSEHERYLCEELFKKPVVITDYPRKIKAFYMRDNDDQETVAAMDVLVPKIGEIIGGSQREERLDRLEKKILEFELDPKEYWWYLELRKYGTVPHAGYGVGFERLIQFATGMENIRDVIPFPRFPGHADF